MNFQYLRKLNSVAMPCAMTLKVAASQTIVKGDLLAMSAGLIIKAPAAATDIIGIANGPITTGATVTAADVVEVLLIDNQTVVKVKILTTGTKKTIVAADCFDTKFDITTAQLLAPDDTTGGMLIPITASNAAGYVEAIVSAAALWNA